MSKKRWPQDVIEVNRLKHDLGLSTDDIAKRLNKPVSLVQKALRTRDDYKRRV